MSNTFDGIIGEFPFIGVDKFNLSASIFLLTHCHSDHLVGINNKSFTGQVYCSKETKQLLKRKKTTSKLLKLIRMIEYNTATRLELPQHVEDVYGLVFVTLIEAYHCVGSSMVLIENSNGAVLVTGDIRAEKWWCDSLRQNLQLYPYLDGHKTLDNIYFDSTFSYRGEPYIEIPANNAGIHAAICLLKEYPKNDPEIEFHFADTVLGFEQAWAFILSYFRGGLRIRAPELSEMITLATKLDAVNGSALSCALKRGSQTGRPKGGVFYAGLQADDKTNRQISVNIKECINFNIMDLAGVFMPLLLSSILEDEKLTMELARETKKGNKLYKLRERLWILPANGNELLPTDIKLIFSRHSSFSEIQNFISMFRPKQVYPCCFSANSWRNGFSMQRLFENCCSGDIFQFDSLMLAQYGPIANEIFTRPIRVVDRWSVDSCKEEERAINEIIEENHRLRKDGVPNKDIALINLRRVVRIPVFKQDRLNGDREFIKQRNGQFQLQKLVEGRREVLYRKFIEAQQMLYYKRHNFPQYERNFETAKYSREFDSTLGGTSDYDTDSCLSSLDLAEIATRSTSPIEARTDDSVVSESQMSGVWDFPSPLKTHRKQLQRSFVKSSFESFEESFPRKRARNQNSLDLQDLLLLPEQNLNSAAIQSFSRRLLVDPYMWGIVSLQCTRPKVV